MPDQFPPAAMMPAGFQNPLILLIVVPPGIKRSSNMKPKSCTSKMKKKFSFTVSSDHTMLFVLFDALAVRPHFFFTFPPFGTGNLVCRNA